MYSVEVDSSFDKTALEFLAEVEDVVLKTFRFFHLAALDVVVDAFFLDLVGSQPAQVVLGLGNDRKSVLLIDLEESKGPKFALIDEMLVLFVEDEVQNLFGLDLTLNISFPDVPGGDLVFFVAAGDVRHDDQLLESVVQVFLVVMERRVLHFFALLLLQSRRKIFNIHGVRCG